VFKVSHHGSRNGCHPEVDPTTVTSAPCEFLSDVICPEVSVVSYGGVFTTETSYDHWCGTNRFGHPHEPMLTLFGLNSDLRTTEMNRGAAIEVNL
jgi:hypothetical protein